MRQALTICPNRHNCRDRQDRLAFTLVELLVVMTIIIVLIGLSLSGVQRIRSKAREIKVRSDISQLQSAIAAFKSNKQVSYIPSRIILREDGRYGDNANPALRQLELASEAYLKKVWPRMITAPYRNPPQPAPNSRIDLGTAYGTWTDWYADQIYQNGDAGAYMLEGDQCMVFFLGGIQYGGGCQGFSTNPSNPVPVPWNQYRLESPYFDGFTADRLILLPVVGGYQLRTDRFASFLDPFGVPYAYFSSTYGNDYNVTVSDCGYFSQYPSPGAQSYAPNGILPYFDPNSNIFYNRDGFQIICAGKNQQFGAGAGWLLALGYQAGDPGADDFSNFSATNLGTGTQAQ
jgi:type II secretory pathway pseudopilin PulG